MSFEPCTDIRLQGLHQNKNADKDAPSSEIKENIPRRRYSMRGRGRSRRGRGGGFIGTHASIQNSGKEDLP